MATYVLHVARTTGLADVLSAPKEDSHGLLKFHPRIRVRIPPIRPFPPRGTTAGRPVWRPGGRPVGRPGGRTGGGPGGAGRFADAGQAIVLAVGAVAVKKLWAWRWYAIGGVGVYVLVRGVKFFRQQRRNAVQNTVTNSTVYSLGENNEEAEAILSSYLLEMLKQCPDLDVFTTSSSFYTYPCTGPSVAFYCSKHLHLQVVNHLNGQSHSMKVVRPALERMRSMMITSLSQTDAVNEMTNGVSFCALSKAGQGIGLFINQELGDPSFWDCCLGSIHKPVFGGKTYDQMSYMAAQRLSSAGSLLENKPGDPDFIIFACDGICNLLQDMRLVEFAYQGVRNGMPLRPLCETLLDLIKSSSIRTAVVLVQFKPACETQQQHNQESPNHFGEGTSSC